MSTLVFIGAPFVLRQLIALILCHPDLTTLPTLDGVEYFAGEHALTRGQWAKDKVCKFEWPARARVQLAKDSPEFGSMRALNYSRASALRHAMASQTRGRARHLNRFMSPTTSCWTRLPTRATLG
jgi:hypothetical protein